MPLYRERLWPSPWLFVTTALIVPASLLVFLPISVTAGIIVAIVLYVLCVLALLRAAAVVAVTDGMLVAGPARVPIGAVGTVTAHIEDARAERGPGLDARAWLLIRGWVAPVVRVEITDPADPVPYWLVSTRHPEAVVEAIERARSAES
ncbi:MAG: DUF3093 domain-containing protein [Microbacteriaceae bacterium]